MRIISKPILLAIAGLAFAATAGFLTSAAIGVGATSPAPTQTVTVDFPPAATGPSGAADCPTGSVFKAVLFNAPGGQVTIYTCVRTP